MGLSSVIVVSLLVAQASSAPSGCLESCTSYHRTYQTQSSSGYQDHAGLTQAIPSLDTVAYAKPGNWTEHNQYRTDGGRGNVHEERGQYVEGPKRVRYYKKNYTSSYSTNHAAGAGQLESLSQDRYGSVYPAGGIAVQPVLDAHSAYGQVGGLRTTSQQHEYNRIHSQRAESLSTRRAGHSERLEDFGEYSGTSQVSQHDLSRGDSPSPRGQQPGDSSPSNWSRVDSYRTDGGQGRVYEEEGQYVTGPKKVRYFKRNYTSSYTSGGIPTSDIATTGVHDVHREIEKLQRVLDREIQQISSSAQRQSSVLQGHTDTVGIAGSNLRTAGGVDYRHQPSGVISSLHRSQEEQVSSTSHGSTGRLPYVIPTQRVYSAESHQNAYERHEGYVPQTEHRYVNPTTGYSQVLGNRNSAFGGSTLNRESEHRAYTGLQQAELVNTHRQSANTEEHFDSDHLRHSGYDEQVAIRPTLPGRAGHYREQWSAASHTREGTFPQVAADTLHVDRESAQYNTRQYADRHNVQTSQGHASYHDQLRQNNFNSASRTSSGNLATGILDVGQVGHGADCGHDTEQIQYGSHYHRNYKRSAKYNEQDDMQQRQSADLAQETEDLTQQSQQKADDAFYSAIGKLEYGQQGQYPEGDDLSQQTTGKLEFGQQREHPYHFGKPRDRQQEDDDRARQTEGQLEFAPQNEDLTQQAGGFQDLFQHSASQVGSGRQSQRPSGKPIKPELEFTGQHGSQTSGKLEFGQQTLEAHPKLTTGNQHLEDLTQRNEDLTQQNEDLSQQTSGFGDYDRTRGKLEFGQEFQQKPATGSGHLEDLSQHNEDLTQQTSGFGDYDRTRGKLEFGQESQQFQQRPATGNQHLEDLTQQNEDLTQQTSGFGDYDRTYGRLEFGQQSQTTQRKPTAGNQHLEDFDEEDEDLTQQTGGFGDFDRTHGRLEFGQQSQKPWEQRRHNQDGDLGQQNEDLTQVSNGFDGSEHLDEIVRTQQPSRYPYQSRKPTSGQETTGTLEFGHEYQHPRKPMTGNQHTNVPSTSGKLEFGQQNMNHQHLDDFTQQNEDLTQQTGKLEFGQQTQHPQHTWRPATGNQHLEDLTQHTGEFSDYTQQTSGKLEFSQQTQNHFQPWGQFTDLTQQNEDTSQQTTGTLGFGGYQPKPNRVTGSYMSDHNTEDETQGQLEFGQQTLNNYQPHVEQSDKYRLNWEKPTDSQTQGLEQHSGGFDFGQTQSNIGRSYQNNYNQELGSLHRIPQTTEEPSGVIPLEQEHHYNNPAAPTGLRPAEKPKPRPRYSKPVVIEPSDIQTGNVQQKDNYPSLPSVNPEADTDDIRIGNLRGDQDTGINGHNTNRDSEKQTHVSAFDIERGNVDQVGWLHKSNDATVGLQWHYTYHPSDLTNSEPVHNSFYPSHHDNSGVQQKEPTGQIEQESNPSRPILTEQQEAKPFESHQSESQNKPTLDIAYGHSGYGQSSLSQHHSANSQDYNSNQRTVDYLPPPNYGVKGGRRRQRIQTPVSEPKLEPRILEAYGGGPYDGSHTDDIYSRVPPNPSVTLPPLNAEDPWDVREKPREPFGTTIIAEILPETTIEPVEEPESTPEPPPPSFWRRVGNKITNTFDKARDKARGIFG